MTGYTPGKVKERTLRIRTISIAMLTAMILSAGAGAQEASPDIELDEYRIVGQDTRIFTISGDPLSVVSFVPSPLLLPDEQRTIRESEGLIGDTERIHRRESFTVTRGPSIDFEYTLGAFKTNDLYAKIGYNAASGGGAIRFMHRSAEANTMTNLAPMSRDLELMGYMSTYFGEVIASAGFTSQKDNTPSAGFRPDNREMSRFRATFSLQSDQFESWAVSGHAKLVSGTYTDILTANKNGELFINGGAEAVGKLWGSMLTLHADTDFYELEDDSGSSVNVGGTAHWLFAERLGVSLGAEFATSAMPSDDAKGNLYPKASIDVLFAPWMYAKASYQPRLVTHTFGDLYDQNGLVTLTAPLVYEDRSVDVSGEIGLRLNSGLAIALGGGYAKGDNAPVFSRFTTPANDEFYDVVPGAELTVSTVTLSASFDPGIWSIEGNLTTSSASWNYAGDVPFIPGMEANVTGAYTLLDVWNIYSTATIYGKHNVERNSTDTEDGFFMLDVGVNRNVWRDTVSARFEIRNLTDAEGSWWSEQYRVPGIGLYAGISAYY